MNHLRYILANTIVASPVWHPRVRSLMLSLLKVEVGRRVRIAPFCRFIGDVQTVAIQDGAFINMGATFGGNERISIGRNVYVGPNVSFLPTTHNVGPEGKRAGDVVATPIVIGDGSWIGAGAIILGSVSLGPGSIVAAGSTVTGSFGENSLVAGTPAILKRNLSESR